MNITPLEDWANTILQKKVSGVVEVFSGDKAGRLQREKNEMKADGSEAYHPRATFVCTPAPVTHQRREH